LPCSSPKACPGELKNRRRHAEAMPMKCIGCGEHAVSSRGEDHYCGRCALRADWAQVARTVQGLVVREAVTSPAPPAPSGSSDASLEHAADPFAR